MNPFEILKPAYETFGAKHPIGSLVAVIALGGVLGALLFGSVWLILAQQYQKANQTEPTPTPTTTNSTSAPDSPIITGNGNSVSYEHSSPQKNGKTQPSKGNEP